MRYPVHQHGEGHAQDQPGRHRALPGRQEAPCTVGTFTYLARKDFFDKTHCLRLTTGALNVLQCGDPTASGAGGPDYKYGAENLPKLLPASPARTPAPQAQVKLGRSAGGVADPGVREVLQCRWSGVAALQVLGERLQPVRFLGPVRIGCGPRRALAEGVLGPHAPQMKAHPQLDASLMQNAVQTAYEELRYARVRTYLPDVVPDPACVTVLRAAASGKNPCGPGPPGRPADPDRSRTPPAAPPSTPTLPSPGLGERNHVVDVQRTGRRYLPLVVVRRPPGPAGQRGARADLRVYDRLGQEHLGPGVAAVCRDIAGVPVPEGGALAVAAAPRRGEAHAPPTGARVRPG